MQTTKCAIWDVDAELLIHRGKSAFQSARAGGKYRLDGISTQELRAALKPHERMKLTTWLCEQRVAGIDAPIIDRQVLQLVQSRRKLSVSQRLTTALMFLSDLYIDEEAPFGSLYPAQTMHALAATESHEFPELAKLYGMLEASELVSFRNAGGDIFKVSPTVKGWAEIDKLTARAVDTSQAFVAMWFDPTMDDAYSKGIEPAVAATGHKAFRVDKKQHGNKIDDEIIAGIRQSKFLIADFTCELIEPQHAGDKLRERARGGVYYEAGFAKGLGIPTIFTCKKELMDYVHFDTRQYAHILWTDPKDLYEQLKNRIGAQIGDGPLPKPESPGSAN